MSRPVPFEDLPVVAGCRGFGYLVTTGPDQRPRVLALIPEFDGSELRFRIGPGHAQDNVRDRPQVTVVFPPAGDDGDDRYSVVVDGDATAIDDLVVIIPTSAVLHRPAPDPNPPAVDPTDRAV